MRRDKVCLAAVCEILGGGKIGKCLVGAHVVEVIGVAIDLGLELGQSGRQIVAGVELVSPG
jgi:hypothetical protein